MTYPRLTLWGLLSALFWCGCSNTETTAVPSTPVPAHHQAATIQVLVNQTLVSEIKAPKEGDSWSLVSLLPEGLPPQAEWLRIRTSNSTTHHTIAKAATAFEQTITVAVIEQDGQLRLDFFDLLGAEGSRTKAAKPHRTLLSPVSIEIVTVESVPEPKWPRLRIEVASQGRGPLKEDAVAGIPQTKNPFKPMHDGGWTIREVVGLYTQDFTGVELVSAAKTVKVSRAQVDGPATMLIRATKKGFWVFKRWEAGNTEEPDETVRNIVELHIIR